MHFPDTQNVDTQNVAPSNSMQYKNLQNLYNFLMATRARLARGRILRNGMNLDTCKRNVTLPFLPFLRKHRKPLSPQKGHFRFMSLRVCVRVASRRCRNNHVRSQT